MFKLYILYWSYNFQSGKPTTFTQADLTLDKLHVYSQPGSTEAMKTCAEYALELHMLSYNGEYVSNTFFMLEKAVLLE